MGSPPQKVSGSGRGRGGSVAASRAPLCCWGSGGRRATGGWAPLLACPLFLRGLRWLPAPRGPAVRGGCPRFRIPRSIILARRKRWGESRLLRKDLSRLPSCKRSSLLRSIRKGSALWGLRSSRPYGPGDPMPAGLCRDGRTSNWARCSRRVTVSATFCALVGAVLVWLLSRTAYWRCANCGRSSSCTPIVWGLKDSLDLTLVGERLT